MPYNYPGRNRFRRKVYKRRYPYRSAGRKALHRTYQLKRLLNVEYKKIIDAATATAITDDGTIIFQITNVLAGNADNHRIGNSIKVVSHNLEYIINQHASATSTTVRVMIVQDRQTNKAAFTAANLLETATTPSNLVSTINTDNRYRFKVFYDRLHTMSDTGKTTVNGKHYRKHNIKIRYDGTAEAITAITTNSLSLVFISNEATNTPTLILQSYLRFIDN